MLTRTATFAAAATIGLSACIWLPSTSANAAAPRAVANVKLKEASNLRLPAARAFRLSTPNRRVGKYNRMFEMYSR